MNRYYESLIFEEKKINQESHIKFRADFKRSLKFTMICMEIPVSSDCCWVGREFLKVKLRRERAQGRIFLSAQQM